MDKVELRSVKEAAEGGIESQQCRHLKIMLYPFIPDYQGFVRNVAKKFRASEEGKKVTLDFIDLTEGYYDSKSNEYIGKTVADVYEIDSVLLTELASQSEIRPLPAALAFKDDEFLTSAKRGAIVNGTVYGYPQWVCANLLFYRSNDSAIANAKTLSDLEAAIRPEHPAASSLLADLKGKSTLGEFYLMSLFDQFHDWSVIKQYNFTGPLSANDRQVSDIATLAALCNHGYCHSGVRHNFPDSYARKFARGKGRVLIGYSESLYDVGAENAVCSKADNCLSTSTTLLKSVNL